MPFAGEGNGRLLAGGSSEQPRRKRRGPGFVLPLVLTGLSGVGSVISFANAYDQMYPLPFVAENMQQTGNILLGFGLLGTTFIFGCISLLKVDRR